MLLAVQAGECAVYLPAEALVAVAALLAGPRALRTWREANRGDDEG